MRECIALVIFAIYMAGVVGYDVAVRQPGERSSVVFVIEALGWPASVAFDLGERLGQRRLGQRRMAN